MKISLFLLCIFLITECALFPSDSPSKINSTTTKINLVDFLKNHQSCQQGFIYTSEIGCIKSCSHNDFKDCQTNFIAIYDPKYCALSKNGNWKSFTFDCQACSKSNT